MNNPRICIFTGPKILSKLPEGFDIDPTKFVQDKEAVLDHYNTERARLLTACLTPTETHTELAYFEQECQHPFLLITQNTDNLHEKAGSKSIIHLKGELLKARCNRCGKTCNLLEDLRPDSRCPLCLIEHHMRPHIIWPGEIPCELESIYSWIERSTLFISIGVDYQDHTSSSLLTFAEKKNIKTIQLPFSATVADDPLSTEKTVPLRKLLQSLL